MRRRLAIEGQNRRLIAYGGIVAIALVATLFVATQFDDDDRSGTSDSSPGDCETVAAQSAPVGANSNPCGLVCDGRPATFVGTNGDDRIDLTEGDDVILALDGDDRIDGEFTGGIDTICAGDGDDFCVASPTATLIDCEHELG